MDDSEGINSQPLQFMETEELSNECKAFIYHLQCVRQGTDQNKINIASAEIQRISTSKTFLQIFINIFSVSKDPTVLFLTGTVLKNLIGKPEGNALGDLEKIKLFCLVYLQSKYNTHTSVVQCLCNVIGRIVKVSFLKDLRQRKFLDQLNSFFDDHFFMQKMKLEILLETVTQVNQFIPEIETRTISRTTSVLFYTHLLLPIFNLCLSILPVSNTTDDIILTPELIYLYQSTLKLMNACLSFDFARGQISLQDEVGLLQLPSDWSEVICKPEIITSLFALYSKENLDLATVCAETILYFISIRRSLFDNPQIAMNYYNAVYMGLNDVITQHTHLEDSQCHSFIAQCLSKYKAVTQLSELLKFPNFSQFYQQVTQFAVSTIETHGYFGDFPFILLFWSRIVEALRFTSCPVSSYIPEEVINESIQLLCRTYIQTFMDQVESFLDNEFDNPLVNIDAIQKYEEKIAIIMNYDYAFVSAIIQGYCLPLKQRLSSIITQVSQGVVVSPEEVRRVDAQLSWCVLIISMTLKRQMFTDYQVKQKLYLIDATFCSLLFSIITLLSEQPSISLLPFFPYLYHTLPSFLQSFCTILDNYKLKTVATGTPDLIQEMGSYKLVAYSDFFSKIASGNAISVIDSILQFILNTLSQANLPEMILQQALSLFSTICHNPHIQKITIAMDSMKRLVVKHTTFCFAAIQSSPKGRYATLFYTSLTEAMLACAMPGDLECFLQPLLNQLTTAFQEMNIDMVSFSLRAACGIVSACNTVYQYNTVYDMLCPTVFSMIHQLLPSYWNYPAFIHATLRFFLEVATNRRNRIDAFDPSPRLVLFFREISTICQEYLQLFTQFVQSQSITVCFLSSHHSFSNLSAGIIKSITILYRILSEILGGCYVPFGAMVFYQDASLSSLFLVLSQAISFIRLKDILLHPKLATALYSFLNELFNLNPLLVSYLQQDVFIFFMDILVTGLSADNETVVKKAAGAIEALATFFYVNRKSTLEIYERMRSLLNNPELFWYSLLKNVFSNLLLAKASLQWDLSRTLLTVILINENGLNQYCQYLCQGLNNEQVEEVQTIFTSISSSIDRSLDMSSKETFSLMASKWCPKLKEYILLRSQLQDYSVC